MLRLYIRNFQSGSDANLIDKVLVEVFGTENPPASSWIGVQALAQPEYLVEIEAMAVIPL
jgi:2-iminobutanoate/2-iminopropanoate deaminase